MRDTNIVAETQAEIEGIEMEAQRINSIIFDNELRADSVNLDYRAGFPGTQKTGKTREPALEPRPSRGPKASPNGILAHADGNQWE